MIAVEATGRSPLDLFLIAIEGPAALAKAAVSPSMSHNTWVHMIVRPIVRPLAKSPVTPNHLTALRLATAVASSLMLAIGDREWSNAAGLVFIVSFLLDRADGDLARQSGKSTPWGHRFDLISDYLANILIFLGMGIGLRGSALGPSAVVLGLLAGFAITGILWLVHRIERSRGAGAAAFPTAAGFDPDDAMLVVPVAIWLNAEQAILIAAAIGAPAFLLWTWWRFRTSLAPS
jgi:phosphatidylglycerophosphate synthase